MSRYNTLREIISLLDQISEIPVVVRSSDNTISFEANDRRSMIQKPGSEGYLTEIPLSALLVGIPPRAARSPSEVVQIILEDLGLDPAR